MDDVRRALQHLGRDRQATFRRESGDAVVRGAMEVARQGPGRRYRSFAARVVLVSGLLVFGAGSLAWAADSSIPGDSLYGIDLAVEDLQDVLGLGSPNARAEERLGEAQQLTDSANPALAMDALRAAIGELSNPRIENVGAILAEIEDIAARVVSNNEDGTRVDAQTSLMAASINDLFGSSSSDVELISELTKLFTAGPAPRTESPQQHTQP